jgi:hypothetical protein
MHALAHGAAVVLLAFHGMILVGALTVLVIALAYSLLVKGDPSSVATAASMTGIASVALRGVARLLLEAASTPIARQGEIALASLQDLRPFDERRCGFRAGDSGDNHPRI